MLKRKFRLSRGRITHQSIMQTPFFTLRFAANGLTYNRYGFIVSKRVDKRAVVRNRTKRRVRSCIESLFSQITTGYDMLFVLKKEAVVVEREKVLEEVKKSLLSLPSS